MGKGIRGNRDSQKEWIISRSYAEEEKREAVDYYLHYVLDLWFEKAVKPKLRGYSCYVRYVDDFLILFENRDEAERVLVAIRA